MHLGGLNINFHGKDIEIVGESWENTIIDGSQGIGITELPNSFSNLTALVQLYISNNQLISLPENFGDLESLYILDLGYNQLTGEIPIEIGNLTNLTFLNLS